MYSTCTCIHFLKHFGDHLIIHFLQEIDKFEEIVPDEDSVSAEVVGLYMYITFLDHVHV